MHFYRLLKIFDHDNQPYDVCGYAVAHVGRLLPAQCANAIRVRDERTRMHSIRIHFQLFAVVVVSLANVRVFVDTSTIYCHTSHVTRHMFFTSIPINY